MEDGTQDHPYGSIQEAIVKAADGDQIQVCPGTYYKCIDFLGKRIEVIGLSDSEERSWPVPNGDIINLGVYGGTGQASLSKHE